MTRAIQRVAVVGIGLLLVVSATAPALAEEHDAITLPVRLEYASCSLSTRVQFCNVRFRVEDTAEALAKVNSCDELTFIRVRLLRGMQGLRDLVAPVVTHRQDPNLPIRSEYRFDDDVAWILTMPLLPTENRHYVWTLSSSGRETVSFVPKGVDPECLEEETHRVLWESMNPPAAATPERTESAPQPSRR